MPAARTNAPKAEDSPVAQGTEPAAGEPAPEIGPAEQPSAAPPAGQTPADPAPPAGDRVVFNGPIAAVVAGVGPVRPGQEVTVPPDVATRLTRGEPALFLRPAA